MSQQIPDLDIAPSLDTDGDYFLVYRASTGTLERVTADQILGDVRWREIAREELGVAGDLISVQNIPARDFLLFKIVAFADGGTLDTTIRFNNDSGTTYPVHYSASFGTATVANSGTSIPFESGATDSGGILTGFLEVLANFAAYEKTGHWLSESTDAAGGATQLASLEGRFKWANTSTQITRFDLINGGTGNFGIGSKVIVYGAN